MLSQDFDRIFSLIVESDSEDDGVDDITQEDIQRLREEKKKEKERRVSIASSSCPHTDRLIYHSMEDWCLPSGNEIFAVFITPVAVSLLTITN